MPLRKLLAEEDGISPVIGVILMVAITVILAAVAGSFVLGLGDSAADTAPQLSIECKTGSPGTITHTGGDNVEGDELQVLNLDGGGAQDLASSTFQSGDNLVSGLSGDVDGDEQIRWSNQDGSGTNIIAEC